MIPRRLNSCITNMGKAWLSPCYSFRQLHNMTLSCHKCPPDRLGLELACLTKYNPSENGDGSPKGEFHGCRFLRSRFGGISQTRTQSQSSTPSWRLYEDLQINVWVLPACSKVGRTPRTVATSEATCAGLSFGELQLLDPPRTRNILSDNLRASVPFSRPLGPAGLDQNPNSRKNQRQLSAV